MRLREFAPAGGGDSGNYFQALASAWYNGTFDSGSLQKGIKSQQDIERLLQRGIVCPDGVTRKFGIDYNSDFDGVVISSDDYYEHADDDDTIDSRTGKPFGPYDYMEFGGEELDESAKWRDPKYKDQLYTQEKPDYNDTREYDNARWNPKPKGYPGRKELPGGDEYDRTDPLVRGAGIGRTGIKNNILDRGKRKGLPSRDQITSLKQSIRDISGRHVRANLPEQGVAEGLPQTLRKIVPGYARREIDKKMDAEKFGRTDVDRDANFQRYKKIQDKLKEQGVAEGSLEEIDRRGFLKGMGAAAVAGAAGGAKADRSWNQDEFSKQWVGNMTSETFPGAILGWRDEDKEFFLNLREPTNYSPNNVRDKRLYYPKITSPQFKIKFGDEPPISGVGSVFTFPLRQLGDYAGSGMTIARGATFSKWRDSFVNADKVVMRLEIDGQPTTVVFYDNPAAVQQRNQQKAELEKQRAEQEKQQKAKLRQQAIDEVFAPGGLIRKGIGAIVSLDASTSESKDLLELFRYFIKIKPELIESWKTVYNDSKDSDLVLGVSKDKWISIAPSIIKKLNDAKDKIESYEVNSMYRFEESVNQGVAEGSDPWGSQGRFVGDTGPTQVSTTVPRVQLRIGDRVLYKPTEQRATIEALSKDGTKARIHISSPMGGRTFNCRTADLKALGALKEKSTSQAQFRTMAAAAHDPKFARKVGIKQSVAQEFNKADKGQSYKSLPKKAD